MKTILQIFVCIVLSISTYAQNRVQEVQDLLMSFEFEKADSLIQISLTKYEGNWDSLPYFMTSKIVLTRLRDGIDPTTQLIAETENELDQHIPKSHPGYLYFLIRKAYHQITLGNVSEAIENYDFVINNSEGKEALSETYQKAIVQRGFAYLYVGKLDEIEKTILPILPKLREQQDTAVMMNAFATLLYVAVQKQEYNKCLEYGHENLNMALLAYGKDHYNTGLIYDQLGSCYQELNDFPQALKYQTEALKNKTKAYKNGEDADDLSSIIGNLGIIYKKMGQFDLAKKELEIALKYQQESSINDNALSYLWNYRALIETNLQMGNIKEAREYLDKTKLAMQPLKDEYPNEYLKVLNYEADILFQEGRYDEAKTLTHHVYSRLLNEFSGLKNEIGGVLQLQTEIPLAQNKLDEALQYSLKSLAYHEENFSKTASLRSDAVFNHLQILHKLHDNTAYEKKYEETIKMLSKNGDNISQVIPIPQVLQFAELHADYLIKERDINSYLTFLDQFKTYYNNYISYSGSFGSIVQDHEIIKKIYHPAIEYYLEKDAAQAFSLSEELHSLYSRVMIKNRLSDSPLQRIKSEISNVEDSLDVDNYAKYQAYLATVRQVRDSLKTNDPQKYNQYFGLSTNDKLDISSLIRKDETLLASQIIDNSIYFFMYTNGKWRAIQKDFNAFNDILQNYLKNRDKASAKTLYESIFIDLEIEGFRNLVFIPDGPLHYLNPEELVDKNDDYLIMKHKIRFAQSLHILDIQNKLHQEQKTQNNILSFTPGFLDEMKKDQIDQFEQDSSWFYLLKQPFLRDLSFELERIPATTSYRDSSATEFQFKSQNESCKILHIGTHGLLNDQYPLFSQLVFSKDNEEDGYLHTYEIFNEDIRANLAVLSACSSGAGKYESGNGINSLAIAFTQSGVPSILLTQWKVDEQSTSKILSHFYRNLKKGSTKSEALRNAKLQYLKESPEELRSPYYWAGLVVIGNDDPLFKHGYSSAYYFKLLLLVVIALLIGFVLVKKVSSQ